MPYVNGEIAELFIGADQVSGVRSYSYNHEFAEVDDSELGEAFDKVAAGPETWSATLTIKHDPADAGQAALAGGAEVICNFYDFGNTTGATYRQGTGVVMGISKELARAERQVIEVTVQGRSALAELSVP